MKKKAKEPWEDDIEKLLDLEDDAELCDQLFLRIVDRYGETLAGGTVVHSISKLNESERTVLLVWGSKGIIENGGFQYLFEGASMEGDRFFTETETAFRTIKALTCASAVTAALKLFPDSKPPVNLEKREEIYQSHSEKNREAIDNKFFSQSKDIRTYLAKYIRDNRQAFMRLK